MTSHCHFLNSDLQHPSKQNKGHQEVASFIIATAKHLLQYGAECHLIEDTAIRIAHSQQLDSVELAISANAIVMTTQKGNERITLTKRVREKNVNFKAICRILYFVLCLEKGILEIDDVWRRLRKSQLKPYRKSYVILAVSVSCAAFSQLQNLDFPLFLLTFIASLSSMLTLVVVQPIANNSLICNIAVAFTATITGFWLCYLVPSADHQVIISSSILMLISGVPLLNATSDIVKGHTNMGLARATSVMVQMMGIAIGIGLAMSVINW